MAKNSPNFKDLILFIQEKCKDDEKVLPFCICLLIVYDKKNKNEKPQRHTIKNDQLLSQFYGKDSYIEIYLVIGKSKKCSCGKLEEIQKNNIRYFLLN